MERRLQQIGSIGKSIGNRERKNESKNPEIEEEEKL